MSNPLFSLMVVLASLASSALAEDVTVWGSIDSLQSLVNAATPDDFALMKLWLLAALRPTGPYPVLALHGPQGSAKSTVTKVLRQLVDPNATALRSLP